MKHQLQHYQRMTMIALTDNLEVLLELVKPNSWYDRIMEVELFYPDMEDDDHSIWVHGPFYLVNTNGKLLFAAILKYDNIVYGINNKYDLLLKHMNSMLSGGVTPYEKIRYKTEIVKHERN